MDRQVGIAEHVNRREQAVELWNKLTAKAPLSDKSAEQLIKEGWKEILSYHEAAANGALEPMDLQMALDKIRETEVVDGEWDFKTAKLDQAANDKLEHQRVRALLKKETEKRIAWEKSQGYR